jgi:hypothetical protein
MEELNFERFVTPTEELLEKNSDASKLTMDGCLYGSLFLGFPV